MWMWYVWDVVLFVMIGLVDSCLGLCFIVEGD